MTKFWLKTRAGWKETKVTEVTGANGGPVQFQEVKQRMLDAIDAEIIDVEITN
jgi:BRCT domain type II-containing protein